jgi:hypothetical protein
MRRINVKNGTGLTTPGKQPPRAWQRMLSGRRLDLLTPSPLDIEIEDIAHGLASPPPARRCGWRPCCTMHRNMSSVT